MILSSWLLFAQPSNNGPCGAIPLPVSNGCILIEGTNVNATNSAVNPRPSCGNYSGGDVWYVVQVPSTGSIEINTKAKQLNNMTMAAYSATTCTGPYTQIACSENGSTFDSRMPKMTINGRPPGSYVFIRIFDHVCGSVLICGENDPHQRGTFEICATIGNGNVTSGSANVGSYNCSTTPPAGNTCETASSICTFNGYCGSTSGYSANYWHSGPRGLGGALNAQGIFCGSIENNSFIKFVAGASDVQLQVIVSGSSSGCDEGVQFLMFGNPTGGPICQSLDIVSYGCESPMPRGTNTFIGSGLTYGQQYYLMVDGYAGDVCTYQINAVSGVLVKMSAGQNRTICLGETVTLSVFGAGPGSIDWTGPYLNTNSGQTVSATPTTTGTFQYIVDAPTLNPACVGQPRDKDTVLVTVIAPMGNVGLTQSGGGCSGGTVTLTASGGTTYTWTPTNGLNNTTGAVVTATPAATTTYTVKASNGSGCTNTNSITVTASGGPALTVSATKDTICTGGTGSVLTASPGFTTYSWSPTTGLSPTSGATVTANPVNPGNYTYTVTGTLAGCPNTTATKTITVISGAAVSVTPASPTICNGQSVTLTASPAGSYNWTGPGGFTQNGVGTITVSPTSNATYTATGISCPSSGSATVNVTAAPLALTAVNGSRCGTGTVGLSVTGACAGTINWYATNVSTTSLGTGSSFTTPSISSTTTYYASCTVGSCEGPRVPVVATINTTLPNANAGPNKALSCTISSVQLDGSSITPGVTFSWSGPGIVSGGNTATPIVNSAGTYTLTVTNPANGCLATGQAIVGYSTIPPNASAGNNKILNCTNSTVMLDGSSSTAGVTFSWTGPGIVSGGNTATPTANATGTYTLTVTNPTNGCTNTAQVTVTSNNTPPNANAGTNKTLTCSNTSIVLDGSSSTAGVTFSWAGPGVVSGGNTATPSVNAAGTYTLTVTNPTNGCTNTAQVTVTSNATPPNANAGTNKTLTCSNTTVLLDGSSSTSGVTFSWAGPGIVSGGSTATPTVNAAGTYTLTVTDPINGCINTAQVNITSNTVIPNANAGINKTLTCTISSVTLDGASTTPGATFSWSGPGIVSGGNTASPTANAPGTYTLTVTDPANGCTNTSQVTVSANTTSPTVNAGGNETLTCSITLVTLDGSSANPGATFSWSGPGIVSGGNTATPTVNAAGTYTLTVTDPANGCTATDPVIVNANTTAPNVNAGGNQTLPCGTTSITLSGSSSTSGVSFSWSGPGIVSGGSTATPTINANGTYILTVTNPANGCTATDQSVVTGSGSIPDANAGSGKTLTCATTSVILDGASTTSGANFSWSGPGIVSGGNTATPVVNAAGTYTLTVTDPANGCTNTAQVTVTANTASPVANAGGDKTLTCAVTSVVLDGSSSTPGATFSWTGPGIVNGGNTATPTVNATGIYTLTVTNPANGCTATDQVNVAQDIATPAASIAAPGNLDCITTTLTLNGSSATAGATFSWNGPGIISGGNTSSPTIEQAGTYTLTVTNPSNGCVNTASATVNNIGNLPDINIATSNLITCAVTQVTLSGSSATSGVTFSWSGPGIVSGGNTATPVVNAAGNYTLTVTNPANNCVATANVAVISDLVPPVIDMVTPNEINCVEAAVVLSAFGNVSNPGYAWTGPGIVSGANTTSPLVNTAGIYTVTVTSPANGCSDIASVNVIENTTPPQVSITTAGTLTCSVTAIDLQGSSTTPGAIFFWSGPGIVSGGNTASPTANAPGTYTLTVTDPANGCTANAAITVSSNTTPPNVNAGADAVISCAAGSVPLTGSSATPGAAFSWSGPGITGGGSTATPTVNAPGTYTLTVTNPANGCTATDDALVTNSTDLPDVDAGPDQIIDCRASSLQLQGSSSTTGVTVLWSGPGITGGANTFTPTVNAAGTYTMTVTNPANGCVSNDVVSVRVAEPLSINADITPNPCAQLSEGAIEITVSGGISPYTFAWSNNAGSQSLSGITGGQYDLTVTDSTGCREELSYIVPQGVFELVAFYDSTINIGESIQLFGIVTGGSGEEVYAWSPPDYLNCTDCEDPLSTPLQNIVYYLTVTDTNECKSIDSIRILLKQDFELYTPSVFTPNGDGINDFFSVLGDTQNVINFKLWIFNRWYETIFYTEDINIGWNGTYQGKDQPLDVYTFAIQAQFSNEKSKQYKGVLVLLR